MNFLLSQLKNSGGQKAHGKKVRKLVTKPRKPDPDIRHALEASIQQVRKRA